MQSLPPIESLECFVAAARSESFRQAARTLHLSPSAFGQRIRQLEEHLSVLLFERTTRKVALTSAGSRLLPQIADALAVIAELPYQAHDTDEVVPRTLTIGTRHELGLSWLNPMLMRLEKSIPGLTLHLYFGSGTEFWERLESGAIDVAVSSARLPPRRFAFEQIHEERYCMVASQKFMKRRTVDTYSSLVDQLLVDSNADLPLARYWLDADPKRARLQFENVRYLGTIAAVRDFVLRREGVAVLPEYFVRADLKAGRLLQLFGKKKLLSDHFRLVYLPKRRDESTIQALAAAMRKEPLC